MRIEIYRVRYIGDSRIVDDIPETVYENANAIELHKGFLFGNVNGEELSVIFDWVNYCYRIF